MPVEGFSEAEIVLKARRRLEHPLFVTIWLGAACFSLAEGNLFYLIAPTFAVAVNLLAVHRTREVYVSRLFINAAVALSTVVMALELLSGRVSLPAATAHYMILIQMVKLFERKRNRDYVQMLAMSTLCVVAAGLFSQALWFAAALAVYVVFAAHTTLVLTLKRGLDASAEARLVTESSPLDPHQVAWNVIRDWPTRALARRLAGILAVVAAMGVGMFFVAPREGAASSTTLLGMRAPATAGYTNSVTLGETRKVYTSDRVLMWVTLEGDGARPAGYLRGNVFDKYDRSRWSKVGSSLWPDVPLPQLLPQMLQGAIVQHVSIADHGLLPTLFAVFPAVRVESPDGDVLIGADMHITLKPSVLLNRPVRYTAYSWPRPLTTEQKAYLATLEERYEPLPWRPEETVRASRAVVELAMTLCRDLVHARQADPSRGDELDLAIAQRIARHLRENYVYSLDLSAAEPDRDGVEDFLFHMKQGHCEYFASAMTVMCRVLGVNAKLATGFLVEEYNPLGAHYVVRERDAHAWTEVFTSAGGWVIFDATSTSRTVPARGGWRQGVDDFWGTLRYLWYRRVIGYDAKSQRHLWQWLAGQVSSAWQATRDALGRSATNLLIHGHVDAALVRMAVATGLAALVLEALLCVRFHRRRQCAREAERELSTKPWGVLRFIPGLLALLEKKGLDRQPGRTVRELALEAAGRFNLPPGVLLVLVELYYRARWGQVAPAAEEIAAAEAQVRQIQESLPA